MVGAIFDSGGQHDSARLSAFGRRATLLGDFWRQALRLLPEILPQLELGTLVALARANRSEALQYSVVEGARLLVSALFDETAAQAERCDHSPGAELSHLCRAGWQDGPPTARLSGRGEGPPSGDSSSGPH